VTESCFDACLESLRIECPCDSNVLAIDAVYLSNGVETGVGVLERRLFYCLAQASRIHTRSILILVLVCRYIRIPYLTSSKQPLQNSNLQKIESEKKPAKLHCSYLELILESSDTHLHLRPEVLRLEPHILAVRCYDVLSVKSARCHQRNDRLI